MLKVANLDSSSPLVYQSAYLTQELEYIIQIIQNRITTNLAAGADVMANEAVRHHVQQEKQSGNGKDGLKNSDNAGQVNRKEIEGNECPICFDNLGSDLKLLTFCQETCGANFHCECIKMWTKQHKNTPSCPTCRQPWVDVKTGGTKKENAYDEGYENLAVLQGQSRVRDTSTYHSHDRSYYKRRRRY
mmetsp:Transcript_21518/g.26398  ORF Transcript_21518/g.26398 Transcript_21518/m.26398 type:complete len:188 (+) Transcript_21518:348-911(+)